MYGSDSLLILLQLIVIQGRRLLDDGGSRRRTSWETTRIVVREGTTSRERSCCRWKQDMLLQLSINCLLILCTGLISWRVMHS